MPGVSIGDLLLGRDLRYAARTLARSPVFLITAALTIALGVGASTAIFSVTNAVLLKPLPYQDPGRLALVCHDMRARDVKDFPFSNADFMDLQKGARSAFEDFAGVVTFPNIFPREDGSPEQIHLAVVTTNFFHLIGAKVNVGRDFVEADGEPPLQAPGVGQAAQPAAPPPPAMAVLSYEYWKSRYGGNPAILGKRMLNGGQGGPVVIGVLEPRVELLFAPSANIDRFPDVWIAAQMIYDNAQRNNVSMHVVGRLKDGVSIERAQSAVELVAAELRRQFPIHAGSGLYFRVVPMQRFLVDDVRPAILALMGAVIFLLLIACANVGNLLLVRASLRERELAVRAALGGNRWRLVRQMLAEAFILAGIGTMLGLGLAWIGIEQLLAIAPANLPRLDHVRIDPVVLGFTVLIGLLAAAAFGIVPALRASRPDVMEVLRGSGRTSSLSGGGILRNAVVILEVALCFVLLTGSGLMIRSFIALQHIDPGYDPHGLLVFQLLGGRARQVPEERAAYMHETLDRLRALPGAQSVTAAGPFPLTGGFSPIRWGLEPALSDPSKFQATDVQIVLPGYFETMHVPLVAGRAFTDADNAPNRKLAIIDTQLAAKAFPGETAVGKRILIRINTPEPEWVEVIGVVAHQRQTSLAEAGREQVFLTDGFVGFGRSNWWAIRTAGDAGHFAPQVRAEVGKLDSHLLINRMQPMEALVEHAQSATRFQLLLIGIFAVIAALLAAGGLYGVLSTVVRQRTAEIGVRMALGAAPSSIFGLMVGHGLWLSAAGIGCGLLAAAVLTRVMTSMLVGVKPTDPATFAAMVGFFFCIAAVSCWIPARRAARLDPTIALRE